MKTGRVNWQLDATINIDIQDTKGNFHNLPCTVDTGFDGDIAFPSGVIQRLGLVPSDILDVILADSALVSMPKYNANVLWQERLIEAEVLQTNGESVIGMSLLENSTLTIQVWDGGEVLIEERP